MNWIHKDCKNVVSNECWNKIPDEYKDSWKETSDKQTHTIRISVNMIYCMDYIYNKNSFRDWFKSI